MHTCSPGDGAVYRPSQSNRTGVEVAMRVVFAHGACGRDGSRHLVCAPDPDPLLDP